MVLASSGENQLLGLLNPEQIDPNLSRDASVVPASRPLHRTEPDPKRNAPSKEHCPVQSGPAEEPKEWLNGSVRRKFGLTGMA